MGKPKGSCGAYKYTKEFVDELADKLLIYAETHSLPFLKDFAYENKIPAEEISRTCAKNEKFKRALNILKDRQEMQILRGGLAGKLNPAMAIFTLKNCSGWRDKQELEHSGELGFKLEIIRDEDKSN